MIICIICIICFAGKLITASYDSIIKIWDLKTNICEHSFYAHNGQAIINLFPFTEGRFISSDCDCTLRIWNVSTGKCEKILSGYKYPQFNVVTVNDKIIIRDGTKIRIWDNDDIIIIDEDIFNIEILPNNLIITISSEHIKIWDLETYQCVGTWKNYNMSTNITIWDNKVILNNNESLLILE